MTQTPSGNGATPDTGPSATDTPATDVTSGTKLPQSIDDALKQIESLQAALKKTNAESASHRHKLKAFEDAQAKADADKLSETEKLQKQLNDLQAARQADVERLIAAEIRTKAVEMGVAPQYLKRVATMLDREDLEIDEKTGMPTNLDKVLGTLLKEMPFLAGKAQASSGGATNPSRTQSSQVGEITRDNLTQAIADYNSLSASQKEQVHQLLINRY